MSNLIAAHNTLESARTAIRLFLHFLELIWDTLI